MKGYTCCSEWTSFGLSYKLWKSQQGLLQILMEQADANGFVYICVIQLFAVFQVWQHFDCMRLETEVEHYLCEQCDPRPIDRVRLSRQPQILSSVFSCSTNFHQTHMLCCSHKGSSHDPPAQLCPGRLCVLHLPP